MAHTRFFGLDVNGLDIYEEQRRQRAFAYYGIPALDQQVQQPAVQPLRNEQPQAIQVLKKINTPRPTAR